MPTVHEELWRYEEPFKVIAVVYRTSESRGRLVIYTTSGPTTIPVPLHPDSPTEDDDRDWFSTVLSHITEDRDVRQEDKHD